MNRWSTDDIWGNETNLYNNTMVYKCCGTFVKTKKCTSPKMYNCNVNFRLWMIMMCQGKFFDCNKCTTVVWNVNSLGGCKCVGQEVGGSSLYFC